jgi:uncharacterized membrane protein
LGKGAEAMEFVITMTIIALLLIVGIVVFVMYLLNKNYDYKQRHHVSK